MGNRLVVQRLTWSSSIRFFSRFDTDGDGNIDNHEFLNKLGTELAPGDHAGLSTKIAKGNTIALQMQQAYQRVGYLSWTFGICNRKWLLVEVSYLLNVELFCKKIITANLFWLFLILQTLNRHIFTFLGTSSCNASKPENVRKVHLCWRTQTPVKVQK